MPGDTLTFTAGTEHAVVTVYNAGTPQHEQVALVAGRDYISRDDLRATIRLICIKSLGGSRNTGPVAQEAARNLLPLYKQLYPTYNFRRNVTAVNALRALALSVGALDAIQSANKKGKKKPVSTIYKNRLHIKYAPREPKKKPKSL
jgi:hypothetical protein